VRAARTGRLPGAFWRLWSSSTVSNLGDGVFLVALPLLAASITDDPLAIALIAVAATLPWLLFSLPFGALVDRHDRKALMVRADVFRAAVVGVLTVVTIVGEAQIWMLWLVAFLLGTAEVLFDNSSQAVLPAIVEPEQLDDANGKKYSAELLANQFIGLPLGGILFAVAVWLPLGTNAISFVVAAVLVWGLRGNFHPGPARRGTTMTGEMREGWRWLWRHRLLRSLAIALALVNLGFQIPQAIFVLYARDELAVSDQWYGVLLGVMGIGAILGGLLAARVVARIGQLFALYSAIVIWAVAMLTFAVAPYLILVTVMAGVIAFATTVWNVISVGLRQELVPTRIFGRVNSIFRWFAWGSLPLGALVGGQVAQTFGVRATYAVGAVAVLSSILVLAGSLRPEPLRLARARAARARALEHDDTPEHIDRDPLFD
jgi:MFS family permease